MKFEWTKEESFGNQILKLKCNGDTLVEAEKMSDAIYWHYWPKGLHFLFDKPLSVEDEKEAMQFVEDRIREFAVDFNVWYMRKTTI